MVFSGLRRVRAWFRAAFQKYRLRPDGVIDCKVLGLTEIAWKADLGQVSLLGFQSSQFRDQANASDLERLQAGTGSRILQLDQGLAGGNLVSLLNEQPTHHAAFEMADGLSFRIDDDRAVGDRRAAEFDGKRPGKKSAEGHKDRREPRDDKTAERRTVVKLVELQARAGRPPATPADVAGGDARRDRRESQGALFGHIAATSRCGSPGIVTETTDVRGPNCVTRPFSSTSSLSATCMMAGL